MQEKPRGGAPWAAPVITWCTCMRNILRVRRHLRGGMCRCRQINQNSMLISGLKISFSPFDGSICFYISHRPWYHILIQRNLHKGPRKTSIWCLLSVWWHLPTWCVISGWTLKPQREDIRPPHGHPLRTVLVWDLRDRAHISKPLVFARSRACQGVAPTPGTLPGLSNSSNQEPDGDAWGSLANLDEQHEPALGDVRGNADRQLLTPAPILVWNSEDDF